MYAIWSITISVTALTSAGTQKNYKRIPSSLRTASGIPPIPYATLINRGVVGKFPEYKYSAYQLYEGRDIINYLRIYEKYPQTEYLLKLGLGAYAENRSLLKKIAKDKAFRKWVALHRKELALPWRNTYNITAITQAYKTGLPLKEVAHFLFRKTQFEREPGMSPIRELFQGWELEKSFDYTEKQKVSDPP